MNATRNTNINMATQKLEDVYKFEMASAPETVVNSCTQWGKLEEVIVARLPDDACFPPNGMDFHGECNNEATTAPARSLPHSHLSLPHHLLA